jgi:alpha-glucosidase
VLRFWLERGVDGFRFDTVNYFFHDPLLRDNPADYRVKDRPEGNPYGMQYHLFDKNQPENLTWMERIRGLLDEYGAASVGEMGEAHHAIRMMGEYTAPGRLHQCYSFEMMGYDYAAGFFRDRSRASSRARRTAGRCGRSPTTTCGATPTRWAAHGRQCRGGGEAGGSLLAGLRGVDLPVAGRGTGPDRHPLSSRN